MILLDGNALSATIRKDISQRVQAYCKNEIRPPHLAAVLVGSNPSSRAYVKNKMKACEEVGFASSLIQKKESITSSELLDLIGQLNANDQIDGYIVQLPLPRHLDGQAINLAIDPKKDVDGFHPDNFGRMALGLPSFHPATPKGIMMMLEGYAIHTEGTHCVVLGRSNIVGTPISLLMSKKTNPGNATVTLAHSRTRNLKDLCLQADIVIAALGIPRFVTADMIKPGAVIIDVGINKVRDPSGNKPYLLVGDVDFEEVCLKASAITPVPGGVGPMTITALLENTWSAYRNK